MPLCNLRIIELYNNNLPNIIEETSKETIVKQTVLCYLDIFKSRHPVPYGKVLIDPNLRVYVRPIDISGLILIFLKALQKILSR